MRNWQVSRMHGVGRVLAVIAVVATRVAVARAGDVLVADRLTDSVYRYSAAGDFLNVVLAEVDAQPEDDFLNQPTGLALSQDGTQLFVSSSQTNTVVRYDYNATTGTAANPTVFADAQDGLSFPNAIALSPDGATVYVSNLGETGVARFGLDGSSAGAPLGAFGGGDFSQFSGLAWTPEDELLVGGFIDSTTGSTGAVGKSNAGVDALATFVGPSASLMGVSGVLEHDGHLYVAGMFAGSVQRFSLADGSHDPSFGIAGLAFPQGLMTAPDGGGLLVGVLGFAAGSGRIAHYDFDGNALGDGNFALPGGGGFSEATAFVAVPDMPGDFNGDGYVNAADLAAWSTNFGDNSGQATLVMGDADGNGNVDGADFLVWQRHAAPSVPAALATPEPAGVTLAALALLALASRRRSVAEATN